MHSHVRSASSLTPKMVSTRSQLLSKYSPHLRAFYVSHLSFIIAGDDEIVQSYLGVPVTDHPCSVLPQGSLLDLMCDLIAVSEQHFP